MNKKFWIRSSVAAAAFGASVAAALAAPAMVTTATTLHDGAGYSSPYLDTLYPGDKVHVRQCSYRWCYVGFQGEYGWVQEDRLSFMPEYPRGGRSPSDLRNAPYDERSGAGVYIGPDRGVSLGFGFY